MLCLVLAALLAVAAGQANSDRCYVDPALLYSGQVFPVPLVFLTGSDGKPTPYVAGSHQAAQMSPAVAQATAEFMAAWNQAVELARKVQATMVRPVPTGPAVVVPKQAQQTAAVKKATADFMATWNLAAQRASAVEVGITFGAPKPVEPTPEVQRATAEFMAAWHAAAERAAAVRAALPSPTPYTRGPRPVEATEEVKRATAEFMKAWRAAAARVPKITATMHLVAGIPSSAAPRPTAGLPQPVKFTPEVEKATAEFMAAFKKAAALAAAAPDTDVFTLPTVTYSAPVSTETYTGPMASGIIMPSGYTKEVDEARREFQLAFDAIAARVAAARVSAGLPPSDPGAPAEYSAPSSPGARAPGAPGSFVPGAPVPSVLESPAPGDPAGVRAPTPEYIGPKASGFIAPSGYTQEVDEARREFMEAYNKAAAFAATSPDTSGSPDTPRAAPPGARVRGTPSSGTLTGSRPVAPASPDKTDFPDTVISVEYSAPGQPAAPRKPAVPSPKYTGPKASGDIAPSGYTKEVDKARKEFKKVHDEAVVLAQKYGSAVSTDPADPADPVAQAVRPARPYNGVSPGAPSGEALTGPASPSTGDFPDTVITVDYSAPGQPAAPGKTTVPIPKYTGPEASGDIAPSGYTKEVDEARKEFQKAHDEAVAFAQKYGATPSRDALSPVDPAAPAAPAPSATLAARPARPYRGPLASGVITPSGFTKEVEAARNEFLTTYKAVAARGPSSLSTPTQYRATKPGGPPSAASPTPAEPTPGSPARPRYTGPLASGNIAPSGYTIEVDEARKEFLRVYKAAAALAAQTPDTATYRAAAMAIRHKDAPEPVDFTPEVAKATAEFMAAWNAAAARVATIEAKLVASSPASQAAITVPTQVDATEEVKKATQEFMAAWYAAARRVASVQRAITYAAPTVVETTEDVQRVISEFLAAWQAAARRAPKIQQAITKAVSLPTGLPQQVEATEEVKKATAEFMAAWNAAALRVPQVETTMYAATQPFTVSIGGTEYFLALLKSAEHKATLPQRPVAFLPFRVDVGFANQVGTTIAYAGTTASSPETVATLKAFPLGSRLFAPVQGLPVFHECNCS